MRDFPKLDPIVAVKYEAIHWPDTPQPTPQALKELDDLLTLAIQKVVEDWTVQNFHRVTRPNRASEFLVEIRVRRGFVDPHKYFGGQIPR